MYIEDYIAYFAQNCSKLGEREYEFLYSLYSQIEMGRTLTTRQGYAAIKMLKAISTRPNFKKDFTVNKSDLKEAIENKRWKSDLRVSVERRREARYIGDNIVALSFPAIPEMRRAMKGLKAVWHESGLYLVSVSKSNFDPLIEFLGVYGFDVNTELEEYLAVCMGSIKQVSHIIAVEDGAAINVCDDNLFADFVFHICGGERI